MQQVRYQLGPLAAPAANNIALSQTPGAAGNLTLNGALVVAGVAILDVARRVLFTTVSNESAKTFTVTGTDWFGTTISEVVAGPNATTGYTVNDYKTVTRIAVSAALTGAVTVGTNGVASSPPIPLDHHGRPEISLQVTVSGTTNWTVQQTVDNPFTVSPLTWLDHPDADMVAETVTRQGNYAYVPGATRITLNSQTNPGYVVYTIIQAGITG